MSQPASPLQPDISQLSQSDLPKSAFPGSRSQAYRIFFTPELHARIWKHARESLAVEICGVLVGSWGRDDDGPFVTMTEAIRGDAATSKFAEVTFTHETWAKINHEMDTRFSHLAIVGWYHTHPDFGIFLSDRDVFIQQHFFSNPGNIAYVVDPVRKIEGAFLWKEGKPALAPHYWVGDKIQIAGAATCLEGTSPALPQQDADNTPRAAGKASPRSSAFPATSPLLDSLTQVLAYLCLFLLGYLLANRFTESDRQRTEENAVARVSLLLGVKPGLREGLEKWRKDLAGLAKDAKDLAEAHEKTVAATGEKLSDTQQEQWKSLHSGIRDARERIADFQSVYCLNPAETERLIQMTATGLTNILSRGVPMTSSQVMQLEQKLESIYRNMIKQGNIQADDPEKKPKETNESKDKSPAINQDGKAGKDK